MSKADKRKTATELYNEYQDTRAHEERGTYFYERTSETVVRNIEPSDYDNYVGSEVYGRTEIGHQYGVLTKLIILGTRPDWYIVTPEGVHKVLKGETLQLMEKSIIGDDLDRYTQLVEAYYDEKSVQRLIEETKREDYGITYRGNSEQLRKQLISREPDLEKFYTNLDRLLREMREERGEISKVYERTLVTSYTEKHLDEIKKYLNTELSLIESEVNREVYHLIYSKMSIDKSELNIYVIKRVDERLKNLVDIEALEEIERDRTFRTLGLEIEEVGVIREKELPLGVTAGDGEYIQFDRYRIRFNKRLNPDNPETDELLLKVLMI